MGDMFISESGIMKSSPVIKILPVMATFLSWDFVILLEYRQTICSQVSGGRPP